MEKVTPGQVTFSSHSVQETCRFHLMPMSAAPHMGQGWKVGIGGGGRRENEVIEIRRAKKLRSGPVKQGLHWEAQRAKLKCSHTSIN